MAAEPLVKFESSKEHYAANACVVWCFDDRFYKLLKAFGKQEGFAHIDLVKIAGGAKALASADGASPDRDFVLNQIKTSARFTARNAWCSCCIVIAARTAGQRVLRMPIRKKGSW